MIVGKAIDDTIARQVGIFGGSEMARPSGKIRARMTTARGQVKGISATASTFRCRRFRRGSEALVGVKAISTIWLIDTRTLLRKSLSRMAGGKLKDGWFGSSRRRVGDKRGASFELPNYDINTNADGLVNKVARQVQERARHLPPYYAAEH